MDSERKEEEQTEDELVQAVAAAREAYDRATEIEKRPSRRRYFEALESLNYFMLARRHFGGTRAVESSAGGEDNH